MRRRTFIQGVGLLGTLPALSFRSSPAAAQTTFKIGISAPVVTILPDYLYRLRADLDKTLPHAPTGPGGNSAADQGNIGEAKIVLAMLVSRFRLRLADEHQVALDPRITLRPRNGMRLTLVPRTA